MDNSTSNPKLKHCGACNVDFESDEIRRIHAKSQWHVENVKRRVAGLPPVDEPAVTVKKDTLRGKKDSDTESSESSSSVESDGEPDTTQLPSVVLEQCLFCNETFASFDKNILHMGRTHGLHVKDLKGLAVDLETLIRYLQLVIFGYRECLFCHSQRRTVQAVQQHMIGKSHCKIDIENPESEYRDFLDPAADTPSGSVMANMDGDSAHLPSGRIISSRAAKPASHHRSLFRHNDPDLATQELPDAPGEAEEPQTKPSNADDRPSHSLVKKQEDVLAKQLSQLRVQDRASLAHLPVSQQLSVLTTQQRQAAKAQRAQRRYRNRVEMMGNRTLMGNFVSDIYGSLPVQMYG
ncbi:cytoplasmic 60S subunit biogenesis factor REI1 [Echria macrotheca]|uniref:Cytoplasmic 60S subunit biogenesis factor REI1 n=1 Tax=Echria macrotheca TaxID=438768 RepID=A0AAJ0B136_9PEZI|nr:cytoplasmic 60S subunit biogenesis factor REI1 [Echria macrotheca]